MYTLQAEKFVLRDQTSAAVCDLVMYREMERRSNMKFCVGKFATGALIMLQNAYGDEAMGRTQRFK